jgi:DNA repair protein RadC
MLTPQQVMEAFASNNLDVMMDAIRQVASRQSQPMTIESPAMYAAAIIHELGPKTREEFWATSLDAGSVVIQTHRMYVGTSHAAAVRPSEILRLMILDDATSFIIAHNHPSSQQRIVPSPEDIQSTRIIYKISKFMGLPMMDHIIVSKGQWFSFLEHDLLEERNVRKNEVQRLPDVPRGTDHGRQPVASG